MQYSTKMKILLCTAVLGIVMVVIGILSLQ